MSPEELPSAPPKPLDLGSNALAARRRGAFSYAQHQKLNSWLYVRKGSGERTRLKLPSSTGRAFLDDHGHVFITDKDALRALQIDGSTPIPILEVDGRQEIVHLHASDGLVWARTRERMSPGEIRVTGDTVVRVARANGIWSVTHSGLLDAGAGSFAATRSLLAVLDESGDITTYSAPEGSSELERLGVWGEHFTNVTEHDGRLLGLSHHAPGRSWVIPDTATGFELKDGLAELPEAARSRVEQWIGDGATVAIHDALRASKGRSGARRRAFMREHGEAYWAAVQDSLQEDLLGELGIQASPRLRSELMEMTVDRFEDAAGWPDED